MKTITVSICDDETYFISVLQKMLDEYGNRHGICFSVLTFSNGEAFFSSGRISDIIFMDVKLPGMNGMETIQRLRDSGGNNQVIFITAYQDYVFQAFDLDAVHYILKPVTALKLFAALDKAVERMADNGKTLCIKNKTGAFRIPVKQVLYCEIWDHQITIHTRTHQYQFSGTLDALNTQLDDRFFRSHRSYLVNMDYVTSQEPGLAVMESGDQVLIARRKQREFAKRLLEVCRKGLV